MSKYSMTANCYLGFKVFNDRRHCDDPCHNCGDPDPKPRRQRTIVAQEPKPVTKPAYQVNIRYFCSPS